MVLWLFPCVPSSSDHLLFLSVAQPLDQEDDVFDMPFFDGVVLRFLRGTRGASHRDYLSPGSIAIAQGYAPARLPSSAV